MTSKFRYELKFILSELELTEVFAFIKNEGAIQSFPKRNINSLYFDTLNFDAIKANLAGVSNRHKIRLRWYEKSTNNEPAVLEIKKRIGRLGSKDKYKINSITNTNIYNKTANQIQNNLLNDAFKEEVILDEVYMPTLLVGYDREYYETNHFRITLDKNINYSNVTMHNKLTHYTPLLYRSYILELKFDPSVKDLVSRKLRHINIIPKRHSKYLVGMAMLGHAFYI